MFQMSWLLGAVSKVKSALNYRTANRLKRQETASNAPVERHGSRGWHHTTGDLYIIKNRRHNRARGAIAHRSRMYNYLHA